MCCKVKWNLWECDKEKANIAGIGHDCAKYLNKDEVKYYVDKYKIVLDEIEKDNLALSHSLIGSYIAKYEFGINDKDIINAIKYHTTGKEDMDIIEKIIYIADLIEEDRDFPGVEELRDLVNEMIEVSKNEILETDLSLSTVNLSNILEKLIKKHQFLIDEKNMNVVLKIESDVYVKCDETRIEKAINNIIINGIKYSPKDENLIVRLYKKGYKTV